MLKQAGFGFLAGFIAFSSPLARAGEKSPFWPAHVQLCRADLSESGQGVAHDMVVNYTETDQGAGTCEVAQAYGYEYGSDTGYRGMFNLTPLSKSGLRCAVARVGDTVKVDVTSGSGRTLKTRVAGCVLTEGGEPR